MPFSRPVLGFVGFEVFTAMAMKNTVCRQSAATCSRWFLARGFFYPEDGGHAFLRNVSSHKIYTALHPRRRHSSALGLTTKEILNIRGKRKVTNIVEEI
jgi:hypothetical protein